jgi:hypothetical protein
LSPRRRWPKASRRQWTVHTIYMRAKVQDPVFRGALIARMRDHPEWNVVLGR